MAKSTNQIQGEAESLRDSIDAGEQTEWKFACYKLADLVEALARRVAKCEAELSDSESEMSDLKRNVDFLMLRK